MTHPACTLSAPSSALANEADAHAVNPASDLWLDPEVLADHFEDLETLTPKHVGATTEPDDVEDATEGDDPPPDGLPF